MGVAQFFGGGWLNFSAARPKAFKLRESRV
jgi:hypothetical protein